MNYVEKLDRPLTNNEVDFNIDSLATRLKQVGAEDMSLILRRDLSRPLTSREMDNNFHQLDLITQRLMYGDGPYPTLDLMFAGAQLLDPRITFTRASSATYFDAMGVLQTAQPNEPRFDYDPATVESLGLLVEGAATNLLRWSEAAWNGWYSGGSVYFNEAFDDGSVPWMGDIDVSFFGPQAGENSFSTSVSYYNAGILDVGEYWLTGLFKYHNPNGLVNTMTMRTNHRGTGGSSGSAGSIVARLYGNGGSYGSFSDTGSGIFGESRIVECRPVGNDWYYYVERFEIVEAGNVQLRLFPYNGGGNFTGDGETGLLRTRLQLEKGLHPTSYIKTEASQVTRASDRAYLTFSEEWFNYPDCTLLFDFFESSADSTYSSYYVSIGRSSTGFSTSNSLLLWRNSGNLRLVIYDGSGSTESLTVATPPKSEGRQRLALAFSHDTIRASHNGESVLSMTPSYLPPKEQLSVMNFSVDAGGKKDKTWRQISVFPRALSDAELQALTA